jgi:surfeit locus 1 family protein
LAVRLGYWQVDRYRQNKAFADHLNSMQTAAPLALNGSASLSDLIDMEYRAAQATGTFDFIHQVAIRNQIWAQQWGYDVGFILITPLIFPDGSAVLVDRGWIPLQDNTPASWAKYDQPGNVTIDGIIRLSTRPEIGGQSDPTLTPEQIKLDIWNLVDINRLQAQLPYPILPVYLQAAPDSSQTGMPYRALPEPEISEAGVNAGYATVWFSFAILLIIGYPVYLRRQAEGAPKLS